MLYTFFSNRFCSKQRIYKLSDFIILFYYIILPVFTCAIVIGNLWSICLGLNILRFGWSETLAKQPTCANILRIPDGVSDAGVASIAQKNMVLQYIFCKDSESL